MRKEERKKNQAWQGDFGEKAQPGFGLGRRAEKGSGVYNLFGCKDAAFRPSSNIRHLPQGCSPASPLAFPHLLQPPQFEACEPGKAFLLRRARSGSFMLPLPRSLWPCPPPREGSSRPGTTSHPTPSALSSSPSPGRIPTLPPTGESGLLPKPKRRFQEGGSLQVPGTHAPSGLSPRTFDLPGFGERLHSTSTCKPGAREHLPGHPPPPPASGSAHRAPGARQGAPGRPSPGAAPAPSPPRARPCSAPTPRGFLLPAPSLSGRRGAAPGGRGGVANGRPAYSGLSPARPPIAAGGGGNIVEWSLDAAAAAGWNGAARGLPGYFGKGA